MATIAGLFDTWDEAWQAVVTLRRVGFRDEDLSIVGRDRRSPGAEEAILAVERVRGEGAATGAFGGGVIGGLAGLVVGFGALMVPGIGPALAAGPLSATLTGGALGAATGGLLGSLVDLGIPATDARDYQSGVTRGGILLTVHAPAARAAEVRILLRQNGLRDLDEHRRRWESDPGYRYDSGHDSAPVGNQVARALDAPAPAALEVEPASEQIDVDHEGLVLAGGASGAVVGGIIGGLVGGPVGAAVGVAVGAAAGGATGAALDHGAAPSDVPAGLGPSEVARPGRSVRRA